MLCVSHLAFAGKLYQIDLIVFKHITNEGLRSENWSDEFIRPSLGRTIELAESDVSLMFYHRLSAHKTGLQTERNLLEKRSDYQILFHTSWIQPMTTPQYAKWIHISGGEMYDQNLPELDGKIRIGQERFFDINAQLYLSLPRSTRWKSDGSLRTFTLIENRRTALNKLNYLDHPLFGALIQIVPYNEK